MNLSWGPDGAGVLASAKRTLDSTGQARRKGGQWTQDALYVIRFGQDTFHEVSVGVRELPDGLLAGKQ